MNDLRSALTAHRATLQHDINPLLSDVQALLRDTAALTGEQAGQAREQFKTRLETLQLRLRELQAQAQAQGREQIRDWTDSGEKYVQAHPWRALGTTAAIAAACGALFAIALTRHD